MGEQAVAKGDRVFREEKDIGWITSSVYSLGLKKPIALGYLRREVLAPGTSLVVDHKSVPIHCEVTTLPFVANSTQEAHMSLLQRFFGAKKGPRRGEQTSSEAPGPARFFAGGIFQWKLF